MDPTPVTATPSMETPPSPESEAAEASGSRAAVHTPDASQLEDRVPAWAQLTRRTVVWTVILGIMWLFFSYQPLWHTDLWGHLEYGRIIVEQRSIPATEPVLPLAQGVPFYDTAWLSQVAGYGLYSWQGVTSLRFLYALLMMGCVGALLIRFRERTDSVVLSLLGLSIFLGVTWKSLYLIRPQLAGLVCYMLLLSLLMKKRWHPSLWGMIPAIFVAWANVHGSFPLGLALLGLLCVGRAIDVGLRTGSWQRVCADERARRLFLLTELALVAVLINPYGVGIFPAVESISSNLNVHNLVEWDPVTLRMTHGKGFALACLLLMLVYRLSPRRISTAEVLLLFGFGLSALWSVRMMVWWTPLAAWFMVLHGSAIWNRRQNAVTQKAALNKQPQETTEEDETEPVLIAPKSGLNTVLTLGLIWIFFAYTPFGATLLHGYPQDPAEAQAFFKANVSRDTPVDLTHYLLDHQPQGLVFNTYEWGDYLLWAGPENLQVYTNSHAHLLPREVWLDYFAITAAEGPWEDKLDRYGVNTVIVDHLNRSRLIAALKANPNWELDYEDRLGAIFQRKDPIVNQ